MTWWCNELRQLQPCYWPIFSGHDDVIKWQHFLPYWPFVKGIHWSLVNSPHEGQWREALIFFFICAWINGWVNSRKAGDLRCHRAHYDVTVMVYSSFNTSRVKLRDWHFNGLVQERYNSSALAMDFLAFSCIKALILTLSIPSFWVNMSCPACYHQPNSLAI